MISNIQMLRALAAIIVFFHHSLPHYVAINGKLSIFKAIAEWGFVGVDIFFIISGFVICHTTIRKERKIQNVSNFIKHRLFRIYLGYWPFFIISFLSTSLFIPAKLGGINIMGSFFLLDSNMSNLLLPVTWSLTYELYFYVIFTFLFAFQEKTVRIIIPVTLALLIARAILIPIDKASILSFLLSPYLIEFFAGAFLYTIYQKIERKRVILLAVSVGITAFWYGIHIGAKNGPVRVFTMGLGSFSLVLTALLLEKYKIFRASGYIVELGDSSYTLYLCHLILLQLFYFTGFRTYLFDHGQWFVEIGFMAFIVFSIYVSHVFYRKIELPLYRSACKINFKDVLNINHNK
jgi:exopolysaccharide production protein ExoZ